MIIYNTYFTILNFYGIFLSFLGISQHNLSKSLEQSYPDTYPYSVQFEGFDIKVENLPVRQQESPLPQAASNTDSSVDGAEIYLQHHG